MPDETCPCGNKIEVMAFRGTGVCSVICRKKYIGDVSSVGTFMFVTTEEHASIKAGREGKPLKRKKARHG